MTRTLVTNGRIIDPAHGIDRIANLLIDEGAFVEITRDQPAASETIDATGLIVCPGFIDIHVHLREPGGEAAETIASGLAAAAAGGFTTVACMPNTSPTIDEPRLVADLRAKAAALNGSRLAVVAAVTRGQRGEEATDYDALAEAGAVAFSDDGMPVARAEIMEQALEASARLGRPVVSHCEGCDMTHRGSMHEGAVSQRLGLSGMASAGEFEMARRDIALAKRTGGHLHLAHISTQESVEAIREAKRDGVAVTAEVTPHHLTLTDQTIQDSDTVYKMNPPLREAHDRAAVREGLADGTLDSIACDHAPHTARSKSRPFEEAPFGVIGLESVLPIILTELVAEGVIDLPGMIERLTIGPARAFGLPGGRFEVGAPADLTLFDPEAAGTIDPNRFKSKSQNCPFKGWPVRGQVIRTVVAGRTVFSV